MCVCVCVRERERLTWEYVMGNRLYSKVPANIKKLNKYFYVYWTMHHCDS